MKGNTDTHTWTTKFEIVMYEDIPIYKRTCKLCYTAQYRSRASHPHDLEWTYVRTCSEVLMESVLK